MTNQYSLQPPPDPPPKAVTLSPELAPHYRPWRIWRDKDTATVIGGMYLTGQYKTIATAYIAKEIRDELRDFRDSSITAWDGSRWVLIR